MSLKPNYKHWRRVRRGKKLRANIPVKNISSLFNVFLTTFVSVATLAVAVATYRTAEQQTVIADILAQLELAKNKPKFAVSPSAETSSFRQRGRLLEGQIPQTITVTPEVGVRQLVSVNGQASVFFTSPERDQPCVVSIRGLFTQSTRDKIHLLDSSVADLQKLIDAAAAEGLRAEGFYSEVLVSYHNVFGRLSFANLGTDGSDLENSGFQDKDITIYAGSWSGGEGFYFDGTDPKDYCPALAEKVSNLVGRTNGYAGEDGIEKLPPTLRRGLDSP